MDKGPPNKKLKIEVTPAVPSTTAAAAAAAAASMVTLRISEVIPTLEDDVKPVLAAHGFADTETFTLTAEDPLPGSLLTFCRLAFMTKEEVRILLFSI